VPVKLERACRTQVLAMSTGQPLSILSKDVIERVLTPGADDRHPRGERNLLFFEAMMHVVDRNLREYAN
jgi:hypothetical protein